MGVKTQIAGEWNRDIKQSDIVTEQLEITPKTIKFQNNKRFQRETEQHRTRTWIVSVENAIKVKNHNSREQKAVRQ